MQNRQRLINKQQGAALIMMAFIIGLALIAYLLHALDPARLKVEQDKKTNAALAIAKQALLAYSAEIISPTPTPPPTACNLNCARPGDLPCPDKDNDGDADTPCAASKVGRLPWKTLGIGDIRDGSGERLWYAVSNQYKNNPRLFPLNSESLGTISYRNNVGNLVYDATTGTGLAAVIIAPGPPLTRSDSILVQDRTNAAANVFGNIIAPNYLDIAYGEDNTNYTESTSDGFVSGEIKVGGQIVSNDMILPITRDEMNDVMETRVLSEVMVAVLNNFCHSGANMVNRTCLPSHAFDYLPDPASITDATCLGHISIANTSCLSNSALSFGRIPVGINVGGVVGVAGWENGYSTSILRGGDAHNWFQQNGWRELIFYSVAPACTESNKGCTGVGHLILNNALTPAVFPSPNNKEAVIVISGKSLAGQARITGADKVSALNYLEDENVLPLDNTYSRYTVDIGKNDKAISIP